MIVDTIMTAFSTLYLLSTTTFSFFAICAIFIYLQWSHKLLNKNTQKINILLEPKNCHPPENIKFVLKSYNASIPQKGTRYSAGYDLKSSETCVIPKRSHKEVKTDIQVILPHNTYGRIASRSGLSFKHGIEVGAGVIDEDYRSDIKVNLHNHSDEDFQIHQNDRIAQFIVERALYPTTQVEDLDGNVTLHDVYIRSIRGNGGFGSTGK